MARNDPREFGDLPSVRRRSTHPFDEPAASQDKPGTPDVPKLQEVKSRPEPVRQQAPPETDAEIAGAKKTRVTRGSGETVRRQTFWLAERDIQAIEELRRYIQIPDAPGVPDKSSVVREAIRRLADNVAQAD